MPRDEPSTRPLIDKLGVKAGSRVSLAGGFDAAFLPLLNARTDDLHNPPAADSDLILFPAESRADLRKVGDLKRFLKQNGCIWVLYPKGQKHITEANVMEAGLAAGLVDNKVVKFSETHTGLRFVIPLARRISD